jgi:UrcA family protein
VKVADLDLNSAPGVATFQKRGEAAAQTFCSDRVVIDGVRGVSNHARCLGAVKAELQEKLPIAQRAQVNNRAAYASR